MLGERLFPLVQRLRPDLAGKITGMLLEMDNSELLLLLESPDALLSKVRHLALPARRHHQEFPWPPQHAGTIWSSPGFASTPAPSRISLRCHRSVHGRAQRRTVPPRTSMCLLCPAPPCDMELCLVRSKVLLPSASCKYVGAACHPLQRVTGVANRLRR